MKKTTLIFIVFLVLGFLFGYYVVGSSIKKGNPAPKIEAQLMDGSDFSLEQLKGNYVLIDFWGSWCPPCRKENKTLIQVYDRYKDSKSEGGHGFDILSIAVEKDDKRVHKAINRDGLIWKNHILEVNRIVIMSSLAQAYKVTDLPSKFLIDPDGNLLASHASFDEIESILSAKLTK